MLYKALACAKLLHELLQETAASIYLRLSVTPCSAAVRAQHMELSPKLKKSNFAHVLEVLSSTDRFLMNFGAIFK